MRVDRRVVVVAGLVLLALLGAGAVVVARTLGDLSCGVEVAEVTGTATELVPADQLAPSGSVGEERRPVIDAVTGLGLGEVVSGRFFDSGVPALVPVGEEVALATPRALRLMALPDGTVDWGRSFGAPAAGGGLVGDELVTLVGGDEPTLVSLDPGSGEVVGCVAVPSPADRQAATLLTDQAGTDVVVAVAAPAAPVELARVEPGDGPVWERTPEGLTEVGSVDVAGDLVVVGRLGPDPVRRSEMAAAGGIAGATVTTYALSDGAPGWSFPADPASTAASVVGGSDGVVVVLASSGRGRSAEDRLVALDADGEEVWSERLGAGYWSASLVGDLVLAQGADRSGGPQLRAFDVASGGAAWRVPSSSAPPVGRQPRRSFGAAVTLGPLLAVPSPNGVLLVDPASGEAERRDSEVAVEQLFPAGDHLVVRTDEALLVLTGA